MRPIVWILVAALFVLHQDYWQWDEAQLRLGFLPHALAYHLVVSLAAALVWLLAVRFCWPTEPDGSSEGGSGE